MRKPLGLCPYQSVGKAAQAVVSSHFRLQNQNKAQICPKMHVSAQPRHWGTSQYIRKRDCFYLHHKLDGGQMPCVSTDWCAVVGITWKCNSSGDRHRSRRLRGNASDYAISVADPRGGGLQGLAAPPQWKLAPLRRRRMGENVHSPSNSARGLFLHRRRYMGAFPPAKVPF